MAVGGALALLALLLLLLLLLLLEPLLEPLLLLALAACRLHQWRYMSPKRSRAVLLAPSVTLACAAAMSALVYLPPTPLGSPTAAAAAALAAVAARARASYFSCLALLVA